MKKVSTALCVCFSTFVSLLLVAGDSLLLKATRGNLCSGKEKELRSVGHQKSSSNEGGFFSSLFGKPKKEASNKVDHIELVSPPEGKLLVGMRIATSDNHYFGKENSVHVCQVVATPRSLPLAQSSGHSSEMKSAKKQSSSRPMGSNEPEALEPVPFLALVEESQSSVMATEKAVTVEKVAEEIQKNTFVKGAHIVIALGLGGLLTIMSLKVLRSRVIKACTLAQKKNYGIWKNMQPAERMRTIAVLTGLLASLAFIVSGVRAG